MTYPRYPAYKDSGVAWLGEVPAHWEVKRLKHVAALIYGDALPDHTRDEGEVGVYGSNGQVGVHSTPNTEAPAIIVGRKGSYGKVNFSSSPVFVIDTAYYIDCRFTSADIRWLFYVLSILGLDTISQDTGVPGLSRESAYNIYLVLPSLPEQRAIAAFLDRETGRIDALIAKQEALIALLEEKRRAVISHAVTRGLDPAAPLKDSGVAWLGMVPAGWEITKVKYQLDVLDSRRIPLSAEERSYRQGEYPYYGASGIIDYIDDFIFDEPLILIGEDGANLVNRSTALAFAAYGKFWVNNHAHILRPKDGLITFWTALLESIDYIPFITGSAQPKLTIDALLNVQLPVPSSIDERIQIDHHIQQETARIDELVEKARASIGLMREHRASLIAAAVTGRIALTPQPPSPSFAGRGGL